MTKAVLLAGCLAGAAAQAGTSGLDRGGLTFDFPAISARHYAWDADSAANLVKGPRTGAAGDVRTAELPDAAGGTYRLSFNYTMSHPEISYKQYVYDLGGVRVFADGRQLANLRVFFDRGDVTAYARTFSVPQGVKDDPYWYLARHRHISLDQVYAYDPLKGIPAERQSKVIGSECCLWSECCWNRFDLEFKLWPRLLAFAEITWTAPKAPRDFEAFSCRAAKYRRYLISEHVNCAPLK